MSNNKSMTSMNNLSVTSDLEVSQMTTFHRHEEEKTVAPTSGLERLVVMKHYDSQPPPIKAVDNMHSYQTYVLETICKTLNQHQVSLW